MKKYLSCAYALLLSSSFLIAPQVSAQEKLDQSPIKVAVGVDPSFAPFFVADARDLFKKHGLNVDVQQYANGGETGDAVVARSVELAGVPDYNLLIRATRADLKAIGVYVEDEGNYVSVVAKKSIAKPEDIKKIGSVPGTFSEYATDRFLKKYNLDSIEVVQAGPPEMVGLLSRDAIDAYILWEPWPSKGVEQGNKVLMPIRDYGVSYVHTLATRSDWLEQHKEEAKALMSALAEAAQYINEHPEGAAEIVKKAAHIPEALTTKAVGQLQFKVRGISDKDQQNFVSMLDFLTERNLIKKRPNLDEVIVRGLAPAAN